jgi:putative ABC transport system substrate-binding protein
VNRRRYLVGIAAALFAPLGAEAQKKAPTIGVLSPWGASLVARGQREPFERGLRDLGWTPGSNILIEQRYAEGKSERLPNLAAELIQMKIDVIVAHGDAAIRAAREATRTIPIVMAAAGDAVSEGHVASLARPGGNVTGLSLFVEGRIEVKQLELLKDAIPGLTRVGILAVSHAAAPPVTAEAISAAARTLGLILQTFHVSRPSEFAGAFGAIGRSRVGALLVRPDSLILDPNAAEIVALTLAHGVPAMFAWRGMVVNYGGLMSYNSSIYDIHRRSAAYVDRILKGARAGDLPVEQPTKFELVINVKTAKALGITIPPTLLLQATEVIE